MSISTTRATGAVAAIALTTLVLSACSQESAINAADTLGVIDTIDAPILTDTSEEMQELAATFEADLTRSERDTICESYRNDPEIAREFVTNGTTQEIDMLMEFLRVKCWIPS